jgi:ABC-type transport system substrate-binding protein
VDLTAENERVWKLAESYEPVGTDDIEFTLKLREGVKFSNGNPLTAEDVMFSMEMCRKIPVLPDVVGIDFEKTNVVDDLTPGRMVHRTSLHPGQTPYPADDHGQGVL